MSSDLPLYFLGLLPAIRDAAKRLGYTVAVHGSMTRDFDLAAVPWVEGARHPEELAEAVRAAVGGGWSKAASYPEHKPHGRLGWVIHVAGGVYLDLSVFPPLGVVDTIEPGKVPGHG